MKPAHNLINNLIYSMPGGGCVMTVVDGKIVYENGSFPTIDIEKVCEKVEQSRQRILAQI